MMKRLTFTFLLLCLLVTAGQAQNRVTLSGYVKDGASGEGLIGASVSVQELPSVGIATNEYGFYSLTLPQGDYTLLVTYLGYITENKPVKLGASQKLDVSLRQNATTLKEVEITTR